MHAQTGLTLSAKLCIPGQTLSGGSGTIAISASPSVCLLIIVTIAVCQGAGIIALNDTAAGRQQNRRVKLVVSGNVIGTTSR